MDLSDRIREAMVRDQYHLRRAFDKLQQEARRNRPPSPLESLDGFTTLVERLEASIAKASRRASSLPPLHIPPELPIAQHAEGIIELLRREQVIIVCGETGSGKSTQLPKIAMQAGFGIRGLIGHTQPRRIAARSVAARLAEELGTELGEGVGFKVRFSDRSSSQSWIKLMTDGILLAETQGDRWLADYDLIIVDEAHERSLNIDFLLGYLHSLLNKRPELRVIITSATLDADRFAAHFGSPESPAPIVLVEGRTYPVEIRYRPGESDENENGDTEADLLKQVEDAVRELLHDASGDMLVFLATESDIRAVHKRLRSTFDGLLRGKQLEILPLYARLSAEEQNRVFRSATGRRIVLATNVAESSLTVPGIKSVIDAGTARISRYAPRSKVQRLPIEPVSRASANQRAGRCGRIAPGICIRLYSEADYEQRDAYTTPEIRRTDLATVILRTESLKLGRVDEFPFLDPPHHESIRDGYRTLFELGAVDDHRRITELGHRLAALPVHPRVARMLVAADQAHCLHDMLIVASGLEIQDVRERPAEKKDAADEKHRQFLDERSDFNSLLKLWEFQHSLKADLSMTQWRKALLSHFLSVPRVLEWIDLHRQLLSVCQESGLNTQSKTSDASALHRSLLTGLLSGVAQRTDKGDYLGAGGLRFFVWPGSGLAQKRPEWIVVNEIVETSRRFGRTAAAIDVNWIESLAEHLISKSYANPHWSSKSQSAMADERVSLFGLPIVPRRLVPLRNHDPHLARRLFIDEGLVAQRFDGNIPVLKANRLLLDELDQAAAKSRDLGRIVEDGRLMQLYEERLPEAAVDAASLRSLLKQDSRLQKTLTLTAEDLFGKEEGKSDEELYPDSIQWGEMQIPLEYCFEPGHPRDGVTATVPVAGIQQLSARQIPWFVPGLIASRIEAMIRSLPKALRRQLVPAPDTAAKAVAELSSREGDFDEAVARCLSRIAGEPIRIDDFELDKLPPHLQINWRLIDEKGEVVAESRDLIKLQADRGIVAKKELTLRDSKWTRDGLIDWDWGDIPEIIAVQHGDVQISAYIGIVDQKEAVGLRSFDSQEAAIAQSRNGLARLALLACRKEVRGHVRWLPGRDRWPVLGQGLIQATTLDDQLSLLLCQVAFVDQQPLCRTQVDWEARWIRRNETLSMAAQELAKTLPLIFQRYHELQLAVEELPRMADETALVDLHHQLLDLFCPEFLTRIAWSALKHYPRYLAAILQRVEKLPSNLTRDQQYRALVEPHVERWRKQADLHQKIGVIDAQLDAYRWLIEEYRVSLWAQNLGTTEKVSPQRLEKLWEQVKR